MGAPLVGGAANMPNSIAGLQTTTSLVVPENVVGSVIGKNGYNLKLIINQSGAHVTVSKPEEGKSERRIEMSGTSAQVQAAQELVQQQLVSMPPVPEQDPKRTVFCGGLPQLTDEATLTQFFSQFGMVEQVKIIYDNATGVSKGFGFVTFIDQSSAQGLKMRRFVEFYGKKVDVGEPNRTKNK